jgi:PKD repeat protein
MKKLLSSKVLLLAVGSMALAGAGLISYVQSVSSDEKAKYEAFLNSHPYNQPQPGIRHREHPDRPDLAVQQDFLMTMDPATKTVPRERLLSVYQYIDKQVKGNSALAASWVDRGPNNVGGRTRAMMYDPNDTTLKKVWVGGVGGGLWYNPDITSATSPYVKVNDLWDNIAVTAIAYDPLDKMTFYVGTGEGWFNADAIQGGGIWRSTDGGASWIHLLSTAVSNFSYIQKIVVHPVTGDVYAGTKSGVWRSDNKGLSWTKVLGPGAGMGGGSISDIEIGADNTIYVGIGIQNTDGIYRSFTGDKGGWTKISGNGFPESGVQRIELGVAPSDANVVYALAQNSSSGVQGLYKSTNKGASWTLMTLPTDVEGGVRPDFTRNQAWYDLALTVDNNNPDVILIGGINLFKYTGTSWLQLSRSGGGGATLPYVHADQHTILFKPGSSSEAIFGNDGGVFLSQDLTAVKPSFVDRNKDYNITQYYACAMHPDSGSNVFLAGAQDNGTQRYAAPGTNSTIRVRGGDGAFCFFDQDNPTYAIASYVYNSFYLSTNGGNSFTRTLIADQTTGSFINPADYDDRQNILYAASTSTSLTRILNVTGSTPVTSNLTGLTLSSRASSITVSPYSPAGTSTIFVGTQAGRLFKLTNAHATPTTTQITGIPGGNISCVEIGASDNELLVVYSNYGLNSIWYTADGGTTWVSKEGNLPDMPVRWALFNPSNRKEVLIATEAGVWTCQDISVSSPFWSFNVSFPKVRTDMLQIRSSDKMVIAATHGRGLFSSDVFSRTAPTADFLSSGQQACLATPISFTNTSLGNITSYLWDFGADASPSTANTAGPHSVSYSSVGTKTVKLLISGPGGIDSLVQTITVDSASVGGVVSSDASVCNGNNAGTLTLSGYYGTIQNWEASTDGGTTWKPVYNPTNTLNYLNLKVTTIYRAVVTSGGCSSASSATATITVGPLTGALSSNTTVCSGGSGALTLSGYTGSVVNWESSTDAGATWSSIANTTDTYNYSNITATTLFRVVLTNGSCTAASSPATVTVSPSTVGGAVSSDKTICRGTNGTLTLGGHTGKVIRWERSTDGGATWSNIANTTVNMVYNNLTVTTAYRAQVQSGVCPMSPSAVATVTVLPALAPSFVANPDTIIIPGIVSFNGTATGATSWAWDFGDGGTDNIQNPSHNYTTAGTFNVKLSVSNGTCSDSLTGKIVAKNPVGIVESGSVGGLRIYPNPAKDVLTVSWKDFPAVTLEIVNSIGQTVLRESIDRSELMKRMDISSLREGIYFVKLSDNTGENVFRKIIIGH